MASVKAENPTFPSGSESSERNCAPKQSGDLSLKRICAFSDQKKVILFETIVTHGSLLLVGCKSSVIRESPAGSRHS
jgi:hypothetical protein